MLSLELCDYTFSGSNRRERKSPLSSLFCFGAIGEGGTLGIFYAESVGFLRFYPISSELFLYVRFYETGLIVLFLCIDVCFLHHPHLCGGGQRRGDIYNAVLSFESFS